MTNRSNLVDRAYEFAVARHRAYNVRYGEFDFSYHLDAVMANLRRFGVTDARLLAAAALHDVAEDTPTPLGEIQQEFGVEVRDLVDAVTEVKVKPDGSPIGNREARHLYNWGKLGHYATIYGDAPINLRLADRLANLAESIRTGAPQLGMYVDEHAFFVVEVRPAGGMPAMWAKLDELVKDARAVLAVLTAEKRAQRAAAHADREAARRRASAVGPRPVRLVDLPERPFLDRPTMASAPVAPGTPCA